MTVATVWRRGRFGAGRVPIGRILPCGSGGGAGRPRDDFRKDPANHSWRLTPRLSSDTPFPRAGWTAGDRPGRLRPVPEIHETALPGVGVRYELTTTTGARLGVVAHRHGRRDLLVYDRADPDAARESVALTAAESAALAALLAASGACGPDP